MIPPAKVSGATVAAPPKPLVDAPVLSLRADQLEYLELILLAIAVGVLAALGNLGFRDLIAFFSWIFRGLEWHALGIRDGSATVLLIPIILLSGGAAILILNYFFRWQSAGRVKPVKSSVPTASVEPTRVVPQAAAAAAMTQATSPVAPPAPVVKPDPVTPPAPVTASPAAPAPFVALASVARDVAVATPAPQVANSEAAKPLPPAPRAEPPKLKKPKEVYYNIVGEPMPSDED